MDDIKMDAQGLALAIFASGTGRVQSIWHASMTGSPVLDQPTLEPGDVPERLTPEVYCISPLDPETLDPCVGLSIIKARGFPGRLGVAGGHKRTNWTPAQPRHILDSLASLLKIGATIEGCFWLNPGRFYVEGALPNDASLWGKDAHDVRFCAVADMTGGGRDFIMVSLTRAVCANTSAVALYSAKKGDSLLKIGHNANIADRWEFDSVAFLGDYSSKVAEHAGKLKHLDTRNVDGASLTAYFQAVIGGEPAKEAGPKIHTAYRWKMNALRAAYQAERVNADKVGIPVDSARVAYEAVTAVASHGGEVTTANGEREWRPLLNGARSDTGRALALSSGKATANALALALTI